MIVSYEEDVACRLGALRMYIGKVHCGYEIQQVVMRSASTGPALEMSWAFRLPGVAGVWRQGSKNKIEN